MSVPGQDRKQLETLVTDFLSAKDADAVRWNGQRGDVVVFRSGLRLLSPASCQADYVRFGPD